MKKLETDDILNRLTALEGWHLHENALVKTYVFSDFKEAFTFMTRVAFEAEKLQHHPDWTNVYNKLTVRMSTHDAGGVTQKDFEFIKKIENHT